MGKGRKKKAQKEAERLAGAASPPTAPPVPPPAPPPLKAAPPTEEPSDFNPAAPHEYLLKRVSKVRVRGFRVGLGAALFVGAAYVVMGAISDYGGAKQVLLGESQAPPLQRTWAINRPTGWIERLQDRIAVRFPLAVTNTSGRLQTDKVLRIDVEPPIDHSQFVIEPDRKDDHVEFGGPEPDGGAAMMASTRGAFDGTDLPEPNWMQKRGMAPWAAQYTLLLVHLDAVDPGETVRFTVTASNEVRGRRRGPFHYTATIVPTSEVRSHLRDYRFFDTPEQYFAAQRIALDAGINLTGMIVRAPDGGLRSHARGDDL